MRQCLIALRLAERLGLNEAGREVVYDWFLIAWVGCHVDAYEQAKWFGDDTAFKRESRRTISRPRCPSRVHPPSPRLRPTASGAYQLGIAFFGEGRKAAAAMLENHWAAFDELAAGLALAERVRDSLEQTFERWDGKGVPQRPGASRSSWPPGWSLSPTWLRLSPRGRSRCRDRGRPAAAGNPVRSRPRGPLLRRGPGAVCRPGRRRAPGRDHAGGAGSRPSGWAMSRSRPCCRPSRTSPT